MENKLAVKHKNSLLFKSPMEDGLSHKVYETKDIDVQSRPFQLIMFPIIACIIFLSYWIILCPLLWALFYRSVFSIHWPTFWPYIFWLVAFIIWLLIMAILIAIWRYLKSKYSIVVKSKPYESRCYEGPTFSMQIQPVQPEVIMLVDMTKNASTITLRPNSRELERTDQRQVDSIGSFGEVFNVGKRKHKELSPLIIHRPMSGNNIIENVGVVNVEDKIRSSVETKTESNANIESIDVDKNSIKDYSQLVTVESPFSLNSSTEEGKSPKTPMSPRELFFIDLIRQADRADNANMDGKRQLNRNSHFFTESELLSDESIDSKRHTMDDKNKLSSDMIPEGDKFKPALTGLTLPTYMEFHSMSRVPSIPITPLKGSTASTDLDKEDFLRERTLSNMPQTRQTTSKPEIHIKEIQPKKNVDSKPERPKSESQYFIANIDSPINERTEVFLKINPESEYSTAKKNLHEWTLDLKKRKKPILKIGSTANKRDKNCHEHEDDEFENK